MTNHLLLSLFFSSSPEGITTPYEFDPVTAEVSEDDDGAIEVLAYDDEGRLDGAMLATPWIDSIQIDASFGDGHITFELVLIGDQAAIRNLDTDLDTRTAEARMSTMLEFAAPGVGPGSAITRRRCMVEFASISAICAGALLIPVLRAPAVVPCAMSLIDTYCECLPLLGYDPCN